MEVAHALLGADVSSHRGDCRRFGINGRGCAIGKYREAVVLCFSGAVPDHAGLSSGPPWDGLAGRNKNRGIAGEGIAGSPTLCMDFA
jgi:hypothetical protein